MKNAIHMLAAATAVLFAAPASASVFDSGVYAVRDAHVSGGSYGRVTAGLLTNGDGAGAANVASYATSSVALTAQARDFSANLAARASTGVFASLAGVGTLTGTGAGVSVFNLTAAQFNGLRALTLAQLGAGAIVNVSGATVSSSLNLGLALSAAPNVLFNFHDATDVTLTGSALGGSILAPGALVKVSGGTVAGAVVSDRFDGAGATIGGRGFAALDINLVSPAAAAVPEPSAWGAMILGLGAVGAGLRRRRRDTARLATC